MERTSLLIDVELKRRMKVRCAEIGKSMSLVARELFKDWLEKQEQEKEQNGPQ